jgi:spermidine synthase
MSWYSSLLPQKIFFHSKINGSITLFSFFGKKTLIVGGATQSGGFTLSMWEKAIKKFKNEKLKIKNCLVLGVGGGTVINILKKYFPDIYITGIEIDPIMKKIARKYFDIIPNNSTNIIVADAFSWLENKSKALLFDLIIIDLYIGRLNPAEAREESFLIRLKKLLTKKGIILFNSHYNEGKLQEYNKLIKYFQKNFSEVKTEAKYPLSRLLKLTN